MFLMIGLIFTWGKESLAQDDFQYRSWATVKLIEKPKWSFRVYSDARFYNDAKDVGLYLASPRFQYKLFDNFDMELHYTYLGFKKNTPSAGRSLFNYQHRAELELNPHWEVGEWLKVHVRNRMEYRWIEDQGSDNTRYRHRWQFTFPLKGLGPLRSVYLNSEFFIDQAKEDYTENRAVPLGLNFRLSDKTKLQVFYMIQMKKGQEDWSSNQILGTHLIMSF